MKAVTAVEVSKHQLGSLTILLFVSYLCVAVAMVLVPLEVTQRLDLGPDWAGLSVGIAFLSTIFSRGYAGAVSDRLGPQHALKRGLASYGISGVLSFAAGMTGFGPLISFGLLIAARLMSGLGESLTGVGVIAWAVAEAGPTKAGRVIAVLGMAIYAAMAVGGPLGLLLYQEVGFSGAMGASVLLPCIGLLVTRTLTAPAPHRRAEALSFLSVLKRVWIPGLVITAQGVGFAAIGAFFALYFTAEGWAHAGWGLGAFGIGFVLVRLGLAGCIERFGGRRVAAVSMLIETLGQGVIWSATNPEWALLGAFLTGCGCSLVFPAMGREVISRVGPEQRGVAIGSFSLFQDLAYGLTGPLAGLLVVRIGYASPFAVGTLIGGAGLLLALVVSRR